MSLTPQSIGVGIRAHRIKQAHARYDFAVNGGAIGTIPLFGGTQIPSGSTIVGGWIEVTTALTSGGSATIAVQVEGAGDVVPAVAVASWTLGRKDIVPAKATSNTLGTTKDIRLTADRDVSVVIATAALTAGKFDVFLEFWDPLG